jgi:hypothetical protein
MRNRWIGVTWLVTRKIRIPSTSLWTYPMNRCPTADRTRHSRFDPPLRSGKFALFFIAACAGIACASATFSSQVQAQTEPRGFPAAALRGTLVVTAPPVINLSGSLVGKKLLVNYTRDAAGLVNEVWVLTEQEARLKRATKARSNNFIFGSDPQATGSQIGSSQPGSSVPGSNLPDPALPQPAEQTR